MSKARNWMVGDVEWKHCFSCKKDMPVKDNFYDYRKWGGALVSRCIPCTQEANNKRWREKDINKAQDLIDALNTRQRSRRFGVFFKWIESGKIGTSDARRVYQAVEM